MKQQLKQLKLIIKAEKALNRKKAQKILKKWKKKWEWGDLNPHVH